MINLLGWQQRDGGVETAQYPIRNTAYVNRAMYRGPWTEDGGGVGALLKVRLRRSRLQLKAVDYLESMSTLVDTAVQPPHATTLLLLLLAWWLSRGHCRCIMQTHARE